MPTSTILINCPMLATWDWRGDSELDILATDGDASSYEMLVSQNRGSQYRPPNTIALIMGTPKMVPLILGNPQIIVEPPNYSSIAFLAFPRPFPYLSGEFGTVGPGTNGLGERQERRELDWV